MSVRILVAVVGAAGVGLVSAACSAGTAAPAEASATPSRSTAPSELVAPTPGVSWLRLSPEQGAPGSAVSLDVACLDNLGAVHSPVLDIGALKGNPEGHQPWRTLGGATVRSDALPGRYAVSTTCGANELSTTFTVAPGRSR
jgi:hypothetical protein